MYITTTTTKASYKMIYRLFSSWGPKKCPHNTRTTCTHKSKLKE